MMATTRSTLILPAEPTDSWLSVRSDRLDRALVVDQ